MKHFLKTLTKIYEENYTKVLNKIILEKISVACFALKDAKTFCENLQSKGCNITVLITKSDATNTLIEPKIINLRDVPQHLKAFEYIIVPGKLEATFLRTDALQKFPVIILSKERKRGETICNSYMKNLDALFDVYNWLEDETSRKAFLGFIAAKALRNLNVASFTETTQYICEGFLPESGALVIDGGACDGSTAAKFTGMGYKVIAFELDEENFKMAKRLADEKNFTVENFGLGAFKHEAKYKQEQERRYTSKLSEFGTKLVKVTTLDDYVREHRLSKVDFIKLDVEGAEIDVLKGATGIITRFKPILAVSIYHKVEHLWTIPKFIKSIRSDYKFALRHFMTSVEDAPDLFNEELQKELYFFTGSSGLISFGECILFAV